MKKTTMMALLAAAATLSVPAYAAGSSNKSSQYRNQPARANTAQQPSYQNQQQRREGYSNYQPRSGENTRMGYGQAFRSGGYMTPLSGGGQAYNLGNRNSSREMRSEYTSGSAREQRRYGSAYNGY